MSGLIQSSLKFPSKKRFPTNVALNENKCNSRRLSKRLLYENSNSLFKVSNETNIIKAKNDKRKILGESSILNHLQYASSPVLKSPVKQNNRESLSFSNIPLLHSCQFQFRTPEKIKHNCTDFPTSHVNFDSEIKTKFDSSPLKGTKSVIEDISKSTPKKHGTEKSGGIKTLKSPVKRLSSCFSPKKVPNYGINSSPKKSPFKSIGVVRPDAEIYQRLKQNLTNNAESNIVGREAEIKVMTEFLETSLTKSLPGSMYISGAPGTGKTASLLSIVDELNLKSLKKVYLNCMNKRSTKDIFVEIAAQFNIRTDQSESRLLKCIEKVITSCDTVLLILDEIDQLDSKKQSILYTVFEWPSLANSKLVLVGIANMLDLTDRILPRLQSNPATKPKLLNFPPYTRSQIINIINDRIKSADIGNVEVIKSSAISFLAGKIAAVAGDVRKALDVCRRAVELTETEVRRQSRLIPSDKQSPMKSIKQIDICRIHKLFNEVYSNRIIDEVKDNPNAIPLQQKVLLCSFLLMLKYAKSKNITISKLHEVYIKVCKKQKLPSLYQSEFLSLCFLLESRGILEIRKAKEPRNAAIMMRLSQQETEQAMGDKDLMLAILEDKESLGRYCSKKQ